MILLPVADKPPAAPARIHRRPICQILEAKFEISPQGRRTQFLLITPLQFLFTIIQVDYSALELRKTPCYTYPISTAAVMSLTIPSAWTQSSGCLPSGDLWGWAISEGKYADMFGGPTVTSSCYPPSYQPTSGVVYAADACPDGFTRACATSTGDSSFTVCCPT